MKEQVPVQWSSFYLKDVSFVNLMMRRIYNVLIVANPYDAFMLEDDGRVEEKIYNEYMELGLRYPPTFTQVSTIEEASRVLNTVDIDLVICMPGNADNDAFDVARAVKAEFSDIHCVVLTPFSHGITKRIEHEDLSIFDYVFCWLGNTNLILSIIKLMEDKMNIEHDIHEVGVQMILLVEDSIRFYSSILPNLYSYILTQSQNFATEALTRHDASLRQRGRPKVVLARNYKEAWDVYQRYKDNCLGVISDMRFPLSDGEEGIQSTMGQPILSIKDPEAGLKLLRAIHQEDEYLPLIIESSESDNREKAENEGFRFVDKNSKKMSVDLRHLLEEHMGFGDFIFRNPETRAEVMRIRNLKDLQDNIFKIPKDSMLYHISRNHVSRWLSARAIFPVSSFLKDITWHKLQDVDVHRQIIFDAIVAYRRMRNEGVVALFDRHKFDQYAHFARIGDGSLGGKGRGLAFLDNVIKRHPDFNQYSNAKVQIPKTVVLCTDVFDSFMERNNLYQIALSDASDDEILHAFLEAQLPDEFIGDFFAFFEATRSPIAVRSSSLLEDSHYQPFAGIYSTYMIPYLEDKYEMLRMLACAIKAVYASVYYRDSKAYMTATSNVIDQEKMAVILQQVVGKQYDNRFYPNLSGVLQQGVFPLPELLQMAIRYGADAMRRPVEIEFAVNLNADKTGELYLLQIRPIVDSKQRLDENLSSIPDEQCLLRSHNSLGHGISDDVMDVVYVKTDSSFTAKDNPIIATEIESINQKFLDQHLNYILVGPGRWGSSDPWVGIPVKWSHISAARIIVEEGLEHYRVDPSQGTHFFQNLTSFGVGYFTINPYKADGFYQRSVLDALPAVEETQWVRHVRFQKPLKIMMDGKRQEGVVVLPETPPSLP